MKIKSDNDLAIAYIKRLLEMVFGLKYVYLASFVLFFGLAFIYNKYSPKIYQLNSTIGPVKDSRSSALASNEMFRDYGTSINNGKELEIAINSLNSFGLIYKTVNDLNLEVAYFVDSSRLFRRETEIYLQSPFTVSIDKSHIQIIGEKFYVTFLSDSTFRLTTSKKKAFLYNYIDNEIVAKNKTLNVDTVSNFNRTISNRDFKFFISTNKQFFRGASGKNKRYSFEFYHPEALVMSYMKNLKIEPVSYLASIIKVQFSSENLTKSINFLNNYINSFLEENLAKKNKIANSTIKFIDSQISGMSDSLVKSESKLRNFRSDNQVMDLSYQGQKTYEQLSEIESQKTNIELQTRYYNYVINYFKLNQDISGVTPPSTANITDPIMNKLMTDLIAMNSEKSTISTTNANNIFLTQIENKIKTQKQYIIENATNNLNTLNLTLNELRYKSDKLSNTIANLPRQEMNMVNIQRKYNLNNTIVTYLLQKRSESAITLSSTYPDYEVLEQAREITSKIIKPKSILNYALSLFLGLLLPTLYLVINSFLSNKITSPYDIERLADRSVFGIIYRNPKKYEDVVTKAPRTAISESFRSLRSALFLKLKAEQSKVVLLTSSQPRDGKSFISFNLAASIASVGYKTVIIDCDLRRPVLQDKFNLENSSGVSSYMTKNAGIDEIIHGTSIDNLSFIPAGPVLPNPSELIDSGVLDELMDHLKEKFEYVLIDAPPIGLVADSIQLMQYASQVLVIARNDYTKKEILASALASLDTRKINNYEVIYNDLDIDKSPYSNYKAYYHKE